MLAACDQVNIILGVDIDSRHFDIAPALWELAPVLHRFICICATTEHYAWHDLVSSLSLWLHSLPTRSTSCKEHGKIITIVQNVIRYYTSIGRWRARGTALSRAGSCRTTGLYSVGSV